MIAVRILQPLKSVRVLEMSSQWRFKNLTGNHWQFKLTLLNSRSFFNKSGNPSCHVRGTHFSFDCLQARDPPGPAPAQSGCSGVSSAPGYSESEVMPVIRPAAAGHCHGRQPVSVPGWHRPASRLGLLTNIPGRPGAAGGAGRAGPSVAVTLAQRRDGRLPSPAHGSDSEQPRLRLSPAPGILLRVHHDVRFPPGLGDRHCDRGRASASACQSRWAAPAASPTRSQAYLDWTTS